MTCALAILAGVGGCVWIVALSRGASRSIYFPSGWRSVFEAWNQASSHWHRFLVVMMIVRKGGGYWLVATLGISTIGATAIAACGPDWPEIIRELKKLLKTLAAFVRGEKLADE